MRGTSSARTTDSGRRLGPADLTVLGASVLLLGALALVNGRPDYGPPPDFAGMPVEQKKQEFFNYLSPIVEAINRGLVADRDRIRALRQAYEQGDEPAWRDRRWLARLAERLAVPFDELPIEEALASLERRAGVVPASLVLVQAAIESGWGTSRFAREANNYFGQRCYRPDCGLAPLEQADDAAFGLARFPSVAHSVESYMLNLNTHPEYRDFRVLRERLGDNVRPISALALVTALTAYSERGQDYVAEVEAMIRDNGLE